MLQKKLCYLKMRASLGRYLLQGLPQQETRMEDLAVIFMLGILPGAIWA